MDNAKNSLLRFTFYRGRVALNVILKALGIGAGDEVAIQAYTCVAVPEGILATGARPLYIDIEPNGFNMNPSDLAEKLSGKVRAIVVQHTFGIPADLGRILAIAQERGIPIVEDCCHAFVSSYKGQKVGSFGVGAFYSFEWGKPIVAGIGGSAILNDESLERKVSLLFDSLTDPPERKERRLALQYYAHSVLYRPSLYWKVRRVYHLLRSFGAAEGNYNQLNDTIAADFSFRMGNQTRRRLSRSVSRLSQVTEHACEVVGNYQQGIINPKIIHPVCPDNCETVYARYPLRVEDKGRFLKSANEANVEIGDWYATPIHPLKVDQWKNVGYEPESCPEAEQRCKDTVTLPTHSTVSKRDVERAVKFFQSDGNKAIT